MMQALPLMFPSAVLLSPRALPQLQRHAVTGRSCQRRSSSPCLGLFGFGKKEEPEPEKISDDSSSSSEVERKRLQAERLELRAERAELEVRSS